MRTNEHWVEYFDNGVWRRWSKTTVRRLTGGEGREYVENGTRVTAQYSPSLLEKAIEAAVEKMRDPLFAAYPHRVATFDARSGELVEVVWSYGSPCEAYVADYATSAETYEPTKKGFVATPWGTQFET